MRRLIPLMAAALLGAGLAAGAITLPAAADDERLNAWQTCMRDLGFDVGGSSTVIRDTGDRVTIDGKEVDADAFHAAERTCGQPFALPEPFDALPRLDTTPFFDSLPDLLPRGELPRLDELPGFELPDLPKEIVPPERCVEISTA